MIIQEAFLKKIKDFGINSYEAKIWTALLSRGVSTAGELSDIAGVPRSRSYDILESLEKKGFIVMKIGKPIKYLAIPPEEVMERVKQKIQFQATEQSKILDEIKGSDLLKELNTLHTQGIDLVNPTELTAVIKGRIQIYNHLNNMIKGAKKSIVLMSSEEGLVRKQKHLEKSLKKAKERGVKIKILTNTKSNTIKTLKETAEVKNTKGIPGRFCLIDNKEIAFMLLDDQKTHPAYDVAVWVNTPLFSETVDKLINRANL